MIGRWAAVAVSFLVLSGCGSSAGPAASPAGSVPVAPGASTTPAPTGSSASAGAAINLANVDACQLIDNATVHALTGESVRFATQGSKLASQSKCFWGAAVPGVPAYVELTLSRSPADLSRTSILGGCPESPVAGVGTEAEGGTCTSSSQRKVYLTAIDGRVQVTVLVNEPKRALEPFDLAAVVNGVFQGVR